MSDCDTMDVACQCPLLFLQAKILACVAMPFPRGSSQPRDETRVSCFVRQVLCHLSHQGSFSFISPYTHTHIHTHTHTGMRAWAHIYQVFCSSGNLPVKSCHRPFATPISPYFSCLTHSGEQRCTGASKAAYTCYCPPSSQPGSTAPLILLHPLARVGLMLPFSTPTVATGQA